MAISTEEMRARQEAAAGGNPSVAQAIQEVSERAQILVREEIELAKAEVTAKVTQLAKGAAVGAAAGIFIIVALLFLLHGFAWLAYYVLPVPDGTFFWGFFLVAGILFLLGAIAGYVASRAFKRGAPPTPDMAIDEAKRIRDTVTADRPEQTI
jgi:Putative Actinobacterial Holin-X, holin superfamily III